MATDGELFLRTDRLLLYLTDAYQYEWFVVANVMNPGSAVMEADDRQVTTVFYSPTVIPPSVPDKPSNNNNNNNRILKYHEALPSSANDEVRYDCTFVDDGNASWYWVCRVPMVEWRLDCENCRHLTVVGLHDTGPRRFTRHTTKSHAKQWQS